MFVFTREELADWRAQSVTSKSDRVGLRHAPMAFTEQGVDMLSSVLNTERAIQVSIAIQSVRESAMDMTGWLEYFVDGLKTQVGEVKKRGEQAIRRDVLVKRHSLSDRQGKALEYIQERGSLTIQDFERLCPEVNRRTLPRDLKLLTEMELLQSEGATIQLVYRMKEVS